MAHKALLVGVNVYEKFNHLRGCVNDVATVREMLIRRYGFDDGNIQPLTDGKAKKAAIQRELKKLFAGAKPGDRVVFHFSGHGSYIDDPADPAGRDEIVCLTDMDFDDPDTFLKDKEIGEWTKTRPDGVRLLVVLDCCHSGNGTREISPTGAPARRVIERDTVRRIYRGGDSGLRSLDLLDGTGTAEVVARFLQPPPEVVRKVSNRGRREIVPVPGLNHNLLAACRRDQTAADAFLEGQPHGAFTFYLGRAVDEAGAGADRKDIERRVTTALSAGSFDQVPQFEGPDVPGNLFGDMSSDRINTGTTLSQSSTPLGDDDLLTRAGGGTPLTPDERRRVLDLLDRLVPLRVGVAPESGVTTAREPGGQTLVYVHGITRHLPGFSKDWWDSLSRYVGDTFGDGALGGRRQEVVWSSIVNRSREVTRATGDEPAEAIRRQMAAQITEVVQERADREAAREMVRGMTARGGTPPPATPSADRGLFDGLSGVDDFTLYMLNRGVREAILAEFTRVVRPLFAAGTPIDLITHSWGTVVGYEGLRILEGEGFTSPLVRSFFTVGAALSIAPVRWNLFSRTGDGRKPAAVVRWINLDAAGDSVGGPLARQYGVSDEFLELDPVGCSRNFFGAFDLGCSHGSYFVPANVAVNRDIFARFILGG